MPKSDNPPQASGTEATAQAPRSSSPKKRGRKTTYHHGDLRSALLAAARECLEEKGHVGLSFREVARKAGVSHAAPYHHFADKHALLAALAVEAFDGLNKVMRDFVEELPAQASVFQKLVALGRGYVHFACSEPAAFKLMWQHDALDFSTSGGLQVSSSAAYAALSERVQAIHAEVGAAPQTPNLDQLYFWSIVHGISSLYLTEALGIPDTEFDGAVHLLLERAMGTFVVDLDERLPNDAGVPQQTLGPIPAQDDYECPSPEPED